MVFLDIWRAEKRHQHHIYNARLGIFARLPLKNTRANLAHHRPINIRRQRHLPHAAKNIPSLPQQLVPLRYPQPVQLRTDPALLQPHQPRSELKRHPCRRRKSETKFSIHRLGKCKPSSSATISSPSIIPPPYGISSRISHLRLHPCTSQSGSMKRAPGSNSVSLSSAWLKLKTGRPP